MRRAAAETKRQRGTVVVVVALAMTALLLFAAYAVDIGVVWSARTQSQNADDAAALAAAGTMISPDGKSTRIPQATTAARDFAAANSTVGVGAVNVENDDISFGYYDLDDRTFTSLNDDPNLDPNNPAHVTAARVNVVMDGVKNNQSPTFFSQLAGRNGFTVNNTAIGYLGFQGSFAAGEFDLPIAIDSCELVSDPDGCGKDFCATVANPPNPCDLNEPQAGDGQVTCLEFSSTPEQNACWTGFDGERQNSTRVGNLKDLIETGNTNDTSAGDEVYLDNGDKTSAMMDLYDKFYGEGDYAGNPAGEDRYPPYHAPPRSDSWVVKLPVVECQDEAQCAGPDPFAITGGVCFEIREVWSPPAQSDRKILGEFICPDDPEKADLYDEYCKLEDDDQSRPGGCNFGFRAKSVVLVE